MLGIFCIICLLLYTITILYSLIMKKNIMNPQYLLEDKDITTATVVAEILKKYNIIKEKDNENDEMNNYVENEIDEEQDESRDRYINNRRHFKFEATNEHKQIKYMEQQAKIEKETMHGVKRIEDEVMTCEYDYSEELMSLSDDLYDSKNSSSILFASFHTMKFIIDKEKPFKYKLISFLLLFPWIITQVGWLFCIMPFIGVIAISKTTIFIICCTITISLLLNILRVLYPRYVANSTIEELIKMNLLKENEIDNAYSYVNYMANETLADSCSFCKWFLNKTLGYKI